MSDKNLTPAEHASWNDALTPVHPGEVLREEFLKPIGVSPHALAKAIGAPAPRINEIARGERGVTADTALRLGRYFGVSPEMWLGLQADYDLAIARRKLGEELGRIRPRLGEVAS
ncbi:MAG TPA: HigA family addiction module antitoxin [Oscillatoriaceae cyanobacterium]